MYSRISILPRYANRFFARRLEKVEGRCAICGSPRAGQGLFCAECRGRLKLRTGGFCPLCGRLYALTDESPYLCAGCRENKPVWSSFSFFASYSGLLKEMVVKFKFGPDFCLSASLGALLYEVYKLRCPVEPTVIIPVPLQKDRLRKRGFNQSLELATQLRCRTGVKVFRSVLEKIRMTSEQSKLPRKSRLKNLDNSFAVRKDKVKGENVLLVDDICTTGSTFKACSKVLNGAGAARVDVLCLARA